GGPPGGGLPGGGPPAGRAPAAAPVSSVLDVLVCEGLAPSFFAAAGNWLETNAETPYELL
ncbi:MAG: hypothetical protein WAU86_18220, partial [Oricola sp.]